MIIVKYRFAGAGVDLGRRDRDEKNMLFDIDLLFPVKPSITAFSAWKR